VWGERLPVADKLRTDQADRRDHLVGQKEKRQEKLPHAFSKLTSKTALLNKERRFQLPPYPSPSF